MFANRDAEEFAGAGEVRNALSRIYNATFFTTSYDYTATVRPLYQSEIWKNSNFSYSFKGLLAKSAFDPLSLPQSSSTTPTELIWDAEPRWEIEYGAWTNEKLDTHQFGANLDANLMDMVQNFSIVATLPPKDPILAGNFTARLWIAELNGSMRMLEPWDRIERKMEPLYLTGTLKFGNLGSLQQYMAYDPEKREYQTLTTRLNFWGFYASFAAINGIPYEFVYDPANPSGNGWHLIKNGEARLHPQDLRFGFVKSMPVKTFWKDRASLSFNVNTNLLIDLQRYTYSRFDSTLGVTLSIKNFLDFTFSTTSENAVIYRYLQDIRGFELPISSSGETNVFKDLLNSFRFDNEKLRTESGFKLKSFNLQATHHMGDWNATMGLVLAPYLEQPTGSAPYYKFNTQFSFLVQWLPISEIKSELSLDKEQWVFK
jgi:hypothetical protein